MVVVFPSLGRTFDVASDQLPKHVSRGLVETHQHSAAGFFVPRIMEALIVRTDENAAVGDGWGSVNLATKAGRPANVFRGFRVDAGAIRSFLSRSELRGQMRGIGNHIAAIVTAPFRPVVRPYACWIPQQHYD